MAICVNEKSLLLGRNMVFEVAAGCADTVPEEDEWKSLGALTSKGKDYSPNTVSSESDDTMGYVENFTTTADLTVSVEGEVRKNDRLDEFGVTNLEMYFNEEMKNARQPSIWIRLVAGSSQLVGYMNITALSVSGGTNDIVTFSAEFKVAEADTISVTNITAAPVTATSGSGVNNFLSQ